MIWRMNRIRIIKKLFVSLTLLVFCELLLPTPAIDPRNNHDWIRVSIASLYRSRFSIDRIGSSVPRIRGIRFTTVKRVVLDAQEGAGVGRAGALRKPIDQCMCLHSQSDRGGLMLLR